MAAWAKMEDPVAALLLPLPPIRANTAQQNRKKRDLTPILSKPPKKKLLYIEALPGQSQSTIHNGRID